MSNQPRNEKQLTNAIVSAVAERYPDAWILKVHGGGYQRTGVPDLLICVGGQFTALEVKHQKPGETVEHARGRASGLQRAEIKNLRKAGAIADVVLSVDEALEAIQYHRTTYIPRKENNDKD